MKSELSRNESFVGLIWLVALCVQFPIRLPAQSFYGAVVGAVTDNTEASVPHAAITITDVGTNDIQTTRSDSRGHFSFVNLVTAVYKMRVEKAGFKVFLSDQPTVEVVAVLRVAPALTVGAVNETVQVTSVSPLLQTDTSSLNTEISASQGAQMPLRVAT